jgi:hypothetical protein
VFARGKKKKKPLVNGPTLDFISIPAKTEGFRKQYSPSELDGDALVTSPLVRFHNNLGKKIICVLNERPPMHNFSLRLGSLATQNTRHYDKGDPTHASVTLPGNTNCRIEHDHHWLLCRARKALAMCGH